MKEKSIKESINHSHQPGDVDVSEDKWVELTWVGVVKGERRRALWKSKTQKEKLRNGGKF